MKLNRKSNYEHKLLDVNVSNKNFFHYAMCDLKNSECTLFNKDTDRLSPSRSSAYSLAHYEESSIQPNLNVGKPLSSQRKNYCHYSHTFDIEKFNKCCKNEKTSGSSFTWNKKVMPNVGLFLKSGDEINSPYELKNVKSDNHKAVESICGIIDSSDRDIKIASPTSSVASQNKPLEWDSLADVGYHNTLASARNKPHEIIHVHDHEPELPISHFTAKLSRLDPEGTTTTTIPDSFVRPTTPSNSLFEFSNEYSKPNIYSTKLIDDHLELKKDTVLTSSVNSNITAPFVNEDDKNLSMSTFISNKNNKSYHNLSTKEKKHKLISIPIQFDKNQTPISFEKFKNSHNTLKRNASMYELMIPITSVSLKRSQSELNLRETIDYNCKSSLPPFNFVSSSSITTIVNKPFMCDKNVQTNLNEVNTKIQESKAIQVSTLDTDKINTNNFKDFLESVNKKLHNQEQWGNSIKKTVNTKDNFVETQSNHCSSLESQEEVDGGRASNSFEYFPGHVYQKLPSEKNNAHRSVCTERSHSTLPNTSSSLDEKLWGNSNSLLRDLERSLNILKSLINTDKYNKQVKKRLIHHVIKRLVTARYTDDKIEHNLEENVPWNPDDARNKIYCTEIIQAFAKKQNNDSTEESFENWELNRQDCLYNKINPNQRTHFTKIRHFVSSEDSDALEERITDKTDGMPDGRRARLGLRSNDNYNPFEHHPRNQLQDLTMIDSDKSYSSECFLHQSQNISLTEKNLNKVLDSRILRKGLLSPKTLTRTNTFPIKNLITAPSTANNVNNSNPITTATSTATTVTIITSIDATPFTPTSTTSRSSNNENKIQNANGYNNIDWRLPTTISERRFNVEKKSKLGTVSQLEDYIKIEKKNQLSWINHEINHLLNLKKLLEEPIRVQKHEMEKEKYHNAIFKMELSKDQWSSHGNLATVRGNNMSLEKTKSDYTQKILHNNEQFFGDQNFEIVDASNTNSQNYQSHIFYSSFQDIGTQTVENNVPINYDEGGQIPLVTEVPINSKKKTKNILNDKCKSESPIVVDVNHETFNTSQNHCYGCLCDKIKRISPQFHRNKDDTMILTLPKISCKCDVHSEKFIYRRRFQQTENDEIEKKLEKMERKTSENKLQSCQSGTRCQKCGIVYTDIKNEKCKCSYLNKKSVAYELCFESKNDNKCDYASAQLKDYLKKNKPNFVHNIEMRKRYVMEISQLREMKSEKMMQLLSLASSSNSIIKTKILKRSEQQYRMINKDQTKRKFRSRYSQSNERKNKSKQQEKSDQLRHNYLMAKIFCKKLQQKVLQGQITLSQSISVISN